jgi:hypothetical protein
MYASVPTRAALCRVSKSQLLPGNRITATRSI